ncbi:hypothetical protein IVB03_32160 [Bradyrhizobium sp. 168]|nr:hypothetical protein [Bradyrhizobium sp. 168]UPK20497.1 hypothetical protein IVA73_05390 [Bradyrhizobium sp. 131]
MLLESTSIQFGHGINDGSESKIGRQHVKTAMRRIGIDALSPSAHHQTRARPQDPSISAARHGDYATEPGLAMEITYILMALGFADLAVVLDCAARRGLSWRLSITMKQPSASNAGVFLGSSRQAGHLQRGSGSQFAGQAFTGVLADNGIAISMDGTAHGETTCLSNGSGATSNTRRCARYDSVSQARSPIGLYLNFHNSRRPHFQSWRQHAGSHLLYPLPFRMAA